MKIFAFHLLNDFSGSPKVLMQLLKGWSSEGRDVTVVTCSGRKGFLSDIQGVKYKYYWYRWSANPIIRLINYSLSQILLVLKMLSSVHKNDLIYVNTVLPFGAALLGKIKGCRVVYHVHETTMNPEILKKFLFEVINYTAHDVIYVSAYMTTMANLKKARIHVVNNAIENSFMEKAEAFRNKTKEHGKNVLMVCSMKDYKGVFEFVKLANMYPEYSFTLVLNTSQEEIDPFFAHENRTDNLNIYSVQTNLHPFYEAADVILNLSRPDGWVETFGLTIIEGMAYGLPAIVPPVGGIIELVENGKNGYKISSRNLDEVSKALFRILEEPGLYEHMKTEALEKIKTYSEDAFLNKVNQILF